MGVRIILLAEEGPARSAYLQELARLGLAADVVGTMADLRQAMSRNPYHGVMVDLLTKIRACDADRRDLHEALARFPVLTLKWDLRTRTLHALSQGPSGSGAGLADFIERECRPAAPHRVRAAPRRPLHLNVLLGPEDPVPDTPASRTVALDFSPGGCFLFSTADWMADQAAWLVFADLDDRRPVPARVRHIVPWGRAPQMPGIGVEFADPSSPPLCELHQKSGAGP